MSRIQEMSRLDGVSIMALVLLVAATTGCKDEIPPPPPDKPAPPVEVSIDMSHMANFKADRQVNFTNAIFVCQPDPSQPGTLAVSLTSNRESPDGSRMIFGAFADGASVESLKDKNVDILGSSMFDVRGSGVFTMVAAYQPKFTRLKIEKIENGSVEGVIKGEFYRFRLVRIAAKPETIEAELRFRAKLVDRASLLGGRQ